MKLPGMVLVHGTAGTSAGMSTGMGTTAPGAAEQDGHLRIPEPTADRTWLIEVDGFDPVREREFESWFTVANGRSGTRGSLDEGSRHSAPAMYVAGFYGRADEEFHGPEFVVGPEWTRLGTRIGKDTLDVDHGEVLELRRVLDLRQGVLFTTWQQRLPSGVVVTLRSARFASMADRTKLALRAEVAADVPVRFAARIPVHPTEVIDSLEMRRVGPDVHLELQARKDGRARFLIGTRATADAIDRVVAVERESDDGLPFDAHPDSVPALLSRHRAAWSERWRTSDVAIEGDDDLQQAVRFALYHLISSGDHEYEIASIGARGLTGQGYYGHVFWDTDVFVLPFFIYTHPETARALLAYRHRGLDAARRRAAALGYRGALYPWEAAQEGDDVTPAFGWLADGTLVPILNAEQEHHISADVAWATWRYWEATGDEGFLVDMGAEILLETARFWASRAARSDDGRYHITGVIGPDEYHETVSDNAFTNALARWNIERALELEGVVASIDPPAWEALVGRLGLTPEETAAWREVAEGLVDGFNPQTRVFEQFAGFHDYENIIAAELAPRPFVGEMVAGMHRLKRSQIVKQADVLQLIHMLPELFDDARAAANYHHYEPRTSHGSSLSPAVHAAVAARVGAVDDALEYFRMAAMLDLDNRMGNAAQGVHLATMGGLWQAAVMGFGGVRPAGTALRIDPRLPAEWSGLSFPLRWRGARLVVSIEQDVLRLDVDAGGGDGGAELAIGDGAPQHVPPGRHRSVRSDGGWGMLEEVPS